MRSDASETETSADAVVVRGGRPARGELNVPGDKSVGHRALLLAALAEGETLVIGLSDGADNGSTRAALGAVGVSMRSDGDTVIVRGVGRDGSLCSPGGPIDLGNSGTTMRLLTGLLAGQPGLRATLVGDGSLSRRPNRRIVEPLARMGAHVVGQGERMTLPLEVEGRTLDGVRHEMAVASAQVKSCILLAGLRAHGTTAVREPGPCRDHTERMLRWFGWPIAHRTGGWLEVAGGGRGRAPAPLEVVGDLSSAAFWWALAAPRLGAHVLVRGVGLNPTRTGFLDVLGRMGARVTVRALGERAGEPYGDVEVRGGPLRSIRDDGTDIGRGIDEVPLIALLATQAEGETRLGGLGELRVKESDRVATTAEALRALGASVTVEGDALVIPGPQRLAIGGVESRVRSHGDHRIAMLAAVAGAWTETGVRVDDVGCVATSYPRFFEDLEALTGATVESVAELSSGNDSRRSRAPGGDNGMTGEPT